MSSLVLVSWYAWECLSVDHFLSCGIVSSHLLRYYHRAAYKSLQITDRREILELSKDATKSVRLGDGQEDGFAGLLPLPEPGQTHSFIMVQDFV